MDKNTRKIDDAILNEVGGGTDLGKPKPRTYTVQPGDTLWDIAVNIYGDGRKWTAIHFMNLDTIPNPEDIRPGTVLRLPI